MRACIIALIFFSCAQKTKVPNNILPPYKMEKLLLDMLRADEFFSQKQADTTLKDSLTRINLYRSVLAEHKTNKEQFERSFIYYENHPDLLKIVLDSMYNEANKKPAQPDSVKVEDIKSKFLKKNKKRIVK